MAAVEIESQSGKVDGYGCVRTKKTRNLLLVLLVLLLTAHEKRICR